MYEQLFERNFGVFTAEEQRRIRDARVVIVGCGGIGGVIAAALARSGLGNFDLYDHDVYSPSNMNRQISCFMDTLGCSKAESVATTLLRINPEIHLRVYDRALCPDEIDAAVCQGDVFIPAADEWPLSIAALGRAKELGKPAIMAYPVGALARVSTFLPSSPYAAECLVMPYKTPYEGLKAFMDNPLHRKVLHYYCTEGSWLKEWFDDWCEDRRPHAQLGITVSITGALAAMEVIKLVSGKWKPVVAPRYWHITPNGARIARFNWARRLLSRRVRSSSGQGLLLFFIKRPWLAKLFTRFIR
jgi:molybdopterin/thiamine biosynthesis adenylyltransferase